MKIGADEVRRVALLAEMAVAEEEIPLLAEKLEGIVSFVGQLSEVDLPAQAEAVNLGPNRVALRADVVAPIPMTHGPGAMAPVFEYGLYVVPRLGGMAAE